MAAIDADQRNLGELGKELEAVYIAFRDGKHQVLVAQAKMNSLKDAIGIIKAQMYAKMSLLKAFPR